MEKYSGLSEERAGELLKRLGKNEILRKKKNPIWKMLLSQFTSPLIILLIAAAAISYLLASSNGESAGIDTILILVVVFASGLAGFFQEYKADKAIDALKAMAQPWCMVIRGGIQKEIPANLLVQGELIVLESGDVVPADAKIIEGNLDIDESMLTGESRDIKKKAEDEIYSGTFIHSGRALAFVSKTGMSTEIGKLAEKMEDVKEEKTPFQIQMQVLGKKIFYIVIILVLMLVIVRYFRFGPSDSGLSFLIAVSLAVAAIPESLPAVLTISLSNGAREMAKKNALVRKLSVVESIGAVDVICTDKTGTITQGKLKVREFYESGKLVSDTKEDLIAKCAYLCNNAKIISKDGKEIYVGDENDIALKEFFKGRIKEDYLRIDEIPFTSERKLHTVVCKIEGHLDVFSKGAPEVLVHKCTKILIDGKEQYLSKEMRKTILEENDKLSEKGRRVLGLAYKEAGEHYEKDLTWLGLVSFSDPPRPEVKEAIRECRESGIRTIMITGDNSKTALSVAREIGLETIGAVSGEDIDKMTDVDLQEALKTISVFARTTPMHKLRILEILQKQGHVVAMTGDGVNDSLAMKKADVGIAMGLRGAEVTKEVSDMILLDDNFATIRTAIIEGRRIFDNIRKFLFYMFACNSAEVFVISIGTVFYESILLYPVQILWINLITDGIPAIAISSDAASPDIMKRKPHKKGEGLINKELAKLGILISLAMSIILLGLFTLADSSGNFGAGRTVLFTSAVLFEFAIIISIRRSRKLGDSNGWLSNIFLISSVLVSAFVQLILLQFALTRRYFDLAPLGGYEDVLIIGGTILMYVVSGEILKFAGWERK